MTDPLENNLPMVIERDSLAIRRLVPNPGGRQNRISFDENGLDGYDDNHNTKPWADFEGPPAGKLNIEWIDLSR